MTEKWGWVTTLWYDVLYVIKLECQHKKRKCSVHDEISCPLSQTIRLGKIKIEVRWVWMWTIFLTFLLTLPYSVSDHFLFHCFNKWKARKRNYPISATKASNICIYICNYITTKFRKPKYYKTVLDCIGTKFTVLLVWKFSLKRAFLI